MIKFRYGPGGALVCDQQVPSVTQALDDSSSTYYGGRYMVGESMSLPAARELAKLLGGRLEEPEARAAISVDGVKVCDAPADVPKSEVAGWLRWLIYVHGRSPDGSTARVRGGTQG